jgi:hypothetical protein
MLSIDDVLDDLERYCEDYELPKAKKLVEQARKTYLAELQSLELPLVL